MGFLGRLKGERVRTQETVETRTVTMYLDGVGVEVPLSEVGRFQGRGFLLHNRTDLLDLRKRVDLLTEAFTYAVQLFVEELDGSADLDTRENGNLHLVTRGFSDLEHAYQEFLRVVYAEFPVRSTEEVK